MPLLSALTRDPAVHAALTSGAGRAHEVARARSWDRLLTLVRERPVTGVVIDDAALERDRPPDVAVADLRRRFASVPIVYVCDARVDAVALFRLGRTRSRRLAIAFCDGDVSSEIAAAVERAARTSTESLVAAAFGPRLARRELDVIRSALDGVQLGWSTDDLAARAGLSRAHLSVRLKSEGLPSAGHLLIWSKLLHAARWLEDRDRSAESVSRQLEYSSGAAFRRALHNYVGMTPTEIRDRGGLRPVLTAFLDVCGVDARLPFGRSVA